MAIIDAFTYNGESDILKLRLNILAPHVERFIICEAKTTFSGNKKPLYFFQQQRYFKKWWNKIEYCVINEDYSEEEIQQAKESPNTKGAKHWQTEFLQKESILKALKQNKVGNTDIVFIGDADEIWEPDYTHLLGAKIRLRVYSYYLNNRSNEEFAGTYVNHYADIKDKCLNHLRSDSIHAPGYGGWHFTSMGGLKEVSRKLNDSYTTESYNTLNIQALLPQRHRHRLDYLGRDFKFTIDESEWPQYLKDHRKDFTQLLWQP